MKIKKQEHAKLRILIVDDQLEILEDVADLINELDLFDSVITASTVSEAVSKISNHSFDIIISDLEMPKRGGIELVELCKNHPHCKHSEIIILSGKVTGELLNKASDLGVKHFLVKPCEPDALISKINSILLKHFPYKVARTESKK